MRRRIKVEGEPLVPFDLTPLIDVVFLLLIFFMVSTRFMDPRGFEVDLPEAATPDPTSGVTDVPTMVVRDDGSALWQGGSLALGDTVAIAEGTEEVTLRVDRAARHGDVVYWMDELKRSGVLRVTLATAPTVEKSARP